MKETAAESVRSLPVFMKRLSEVAKQSDSQLVLAACQDLLEYARTSNQVPDPAATREVLDLLRGSRHFEALSVLTDALIRMGRGELIVSRQYVQGLIDQGLLIAAREVLGGVIRRATNDPTEYSETRGLLGRVNKQIYVEARGRPSDLARRALRQAIACYREVYDEDPQKHLWHGVNLLALMHRARADGITVKGLPDPGILASAIVEAVRSPQGRTVEAWDYGSAAEACIALGDWDAATHWLERYIRHQSTDSFALAGTLRQLTEVWRFTADTPEAGQLVVALSGALLRSRDGRLELTPGQLQRTAAALDNPGPRLERVLGTVGLQTITWLRAGIERARSVALIRGPGGRGIGTGFLVCGGDLHPALGGELVVVTNAHVVSELQDDGGIEPDQALITFEAQNGTAGTQPYYRIQKLLWASPKQHLDTSILRLDPMVQGIAPCRIAKSLPPKNDQRVYIIGHPKGGELSFSLQDNELLDHEGPPAGAPRQPERCLIHYRAPTEPGSSGSPVFNEAPDWEVIGLHHAGGEYVRKLNGHPGTYAANEAIWIQSIAKAMADGFNV